MPTHNEEKLFREQYARLTPSQRAAFRAAVDKFVHDLRVGKFRKGLRIKGVQGHPGVYEMTWAADGRATFSYGASVRPGDPHINWRRVGAHDNFEHP